jgi:GNAT superfamily N-acetyltransferase
VKLEQAMATVWHLEVRSLTELVPARGERQFGLERLIGPTPAVARALYAGVGADYHWADRLPWSDAEWAERIADPRVEFWLASEGGTPVGYFELCRNDPETMEVAYFGLLPHAVGKGHGGQLLEAAVRRGFEAGAERVYLHTCSFDHPAALKNYQARGFTVIRTEQALRTVSVT